MNSVTQALCDFIGIPLVADITNEHNIALVEQWRDGTVVPDVDQLETIVFTWFMLQEITAHRCEDTARAWFTKDNESLFGRTPADAVKEGDLYDVQVAARKEIMGK